MTYLILRRSRSLKPWHGWELHRAVAVDSRNIKAKILKYFENYKNTYILKRNLVAVCGILERMSSRWYPIYQKGNPQLRVFLPNFYMKLVHNKVANVPSNRIEFHVSMGMSKHDIKQYLQKIYNVPVVDVHTLIQQGVFKKAPGKNYIIKEDDYKRAFVILPKDYKFEFPDIFPKDKINQEIENEKKLRETVELDHKKAKDKQKLRPDVPRWFA